VAKISWYGYPPARLTVRRLTLRRMRAPIFSTFKRMVWQVAVASSVAFKPTRRNSLRNT
jgi:hypothetical protein